MNEARVYADGFERSFAEVKDLLEFLAERGRNAKWIRKPTNTLRLAPLEKEAQNLDAADASMEEILEDTEKNTQLVLKMRGESYPVRDCAIRTILSRAGVNGDGLRKLDKATYAKVVNYCLRVAKGDALIKIADGKVSAVHGGDKHDYCILDMKAMFETKLTMIKRILVCIQRQRIFISEIIKCNYTIPINLCILSTRSVSLERPYN